MEYNITYGALINNTPVVTLPLAKANSNIESDHEDELLQLLLDAAIEDAQNYVDTPLAERNVAIGLPSWPTIFELPVYPANQITSINYADTNGATQTVATTDYHFYKKMTGDKVKFTWDNQPELQEGNPFPITINCEAGYTAEEMPKAVKNAVLVRFTHREKYREDVPTSYNRMFQAILRPLKRWG